MALSRQFDKPDKNRKWREGVLKSSFNYLLLDPRYGLSSQLSPCTMSKQSGFCHLSLRGFL